MNKLKLDIELTYDAKLMHGNEEESIGWFSNDILMKEKLILHSNDIGDEIGTVKVIKIKK